MNNIIWKDIKGYEGRYQISNNGLVKSLNYRRTGRPGILSLANEKGYRRCSLRDFDGNDKSYLVHRLVANAFLPMANDEQVTVNHKNGNRGDNRVENLEWASYKEQVIHADEELGKNNRGENSGNAKLTRSDVKRILNLIDNGKSDIEISKIFNVSHASIYGIKTGKRWSHISNIEKHNTGKGIKLNKIIVEEIRDKGKLGFSQKELSNIYNVSIPTISRIINRKIWS